MFLPSSFLSPLFSASVRPLCVLCVLPSFSSIPIETSPTKTSPPRVFPCKNCGGKLVFAPGQDALQCPYCGTLNEIAGDTSAVRELDYAAALAHVAGAKETEDRIVVHCDACGADVPMKPNVTAQRCDFCGSPIVATAQTRKVITPQALLPFAITINQSREMFSAWIGKRWFAPSDLKKFAVVDGRLNGFYLPYWTYDAHADTPYTGQRGDDYYTTETYTTTINGRPTTQTRQVRHTRWTGVRGRVENNFDDVLVPASTSLPPALLVKLDQWDLDRLVSYRDDYLAGFKAESYTVDLPHGFASAQVFMVDQIKVTIQSDIGGDHQVIESMHPAFDDITFKHILLPVWIAAYRYRDKTYRFIVNARSGQIVGDRPYSTIKIVLFTLMCLVIAGIVAAIYIATQNR
ncbi:hypothetical protein BH11PLA1_BH11PLA1_16350 [soil metagenome]